MNRSVNLSEKNLQTNIRHLTEEIMHDLFLVCRKAGIYTIDHPMVAESVNRPYMAMKRLYDFKKYFSLFLMEGRLYANNILMSNAGAVHYLRDRMHELDLHSILFDESLTTEDMVAFIGRFVTKVAPTHRDYRLDNFLKHRRITSIAVNAPLARKLYEAGQRYREAQYYDLTVRQIVSDYFAGDTDLAVTVLSGAYQGTEELAQATGIDYHADIVSYILPEKFSQLPPSQLAEMVESVFAQNDQIDEAVMERLANLIRSFDFHPKRDELAGLVHEKLQSRGVDGNITRRLISGAIGVKFDVAQNIDRLFRRLFSEETDESLPGQFIDAFTRLVRTRQVGKAASVTEGVVEYLASSSARYRQDAIVLLKQIIALAPSLGELEFLDSVLRFMKSVFTRGQETFEYSEVAICLLRVMIAQCRYEAVAEYLTTLGSARHDSDGIAVYDSVTVRRIFEDLNNREIITHLVRELEQSPAVAAQPVRSILMTLRSEEVALQLAEIVAHPNRQIRQHSLKILSGLGLPAVKIFSAVLGDERHFLRPIDRRELPDQQWFLVRNAIFVLGNLRHPEASHALRHRLSDPDVRVRLEIVKALEKIGGNEAVDLLMVLAEDPEESVSEAAIITLGLFRQADLLPFFADLLERYRVHLQRIIVSIGMIGSSEARDYLISLFENEERLRALSSGRASTDDIRNMIIQALEKFVDEASSDLVKQYKIRDTGLAKTAKIFLGKFAGR